MPRGVAEKAGGAIGELLLADEPAEAKTAPAKTLRETEDWLWSQRKLALDTGGYYAAMAFEKAASHLRTTLDLLFGERAQPRWNAATNSWEETG